MNIRLHESNWSDVECDALLVPIFQDENCEEGLAGDLNAKLQGLLTEMRDNAELEGKIEDLAVIYRPQGLPVGRLILLGSGPLKDYSANVIRRVASRAIRKFKAYSLKRVAFYWRDGMKASLAAQAAIEGVILGTFDTDEYRTDRRSKTCIEELLFVTSQSVDRSSVMQAIRKGEILAEATNTTRTLVNQPGNRITPTRLAEKAREIAERYAMGVEVLDEPDMEERGMSALLAVARGSDEPARLIVLKHLGAEDPADPPVILIGKGVTFDSGGLSLKPSQSMEDMKTDKAGACAVLGAMQAIAQLQIKRNVIGIMPTVENLPSGRAQRPGDVVRSMSGKTIEVLNTDAEGRLILADAIHYAHQFKPEFIVDLATLTGACVIALGKLRAGLFSNDEELSQRVLQAAERAGEKVWRLPLDDDYRKELDSSIADIKNVGEKWGGAITAAKFLEEFVGDVPWCHLDIAGVDVIEYQNQIKSPTGFGVRTLVELVSD